MALKSLNQLHHFRNFLIRMRNAWIQKTRGVVMGPNASVSLSSRFLSNGPDQIVIGADTLIAFKTLFVTRDGVSGQILPITIGSRCFIGGGSVILPGVSIGDECIVGGGSVVFEDVPARSIVVGNPARVLRSDIDVGTYGRLKGADENTRQLYRF